MFVMLSQRQTLLASSLHNLFTSVLRKNGLSYPGLELKIYHHFAATSLPQTNHFLVKLQITCDFRHGL